MATARDRDARAFGAAANFMPSRQGDKNNRCLVILEIWWWQLKHFLMFTPM